MSMELFEGKIVPIDISEELKKDSVINCKKDLSEKKIFIVFMVKKILLKFHLKQMCQM